MATMIPLIAFVLGTALVAAFAYALMPSRADAIDRRLEELTLPQGEEAKPRYQSVVKLFKRLGERVPKSPREMGTLRLGANNALPASGTLTTRTGGVFDLYGFNQTVAGLGTINGGPNPGGTGPGAAGRVVNSGRSRPWSIATAKR